MSLKCTMLKNCWFKIRKRIETHWLRLTCGIATSTVINRNRQKQIHQGLIIVGVCPAKMIHSIQYTMPRYIMEKKKLTCRFLPKESPKDFCEETFICNG